MFAIGEKTTEVNKSRVAMPVEYHLRKRKIYGTRVGPDLLYISDEVGPLKVKKGGEIFTPHVDKRNMLHVPGRYEGRKVEIKGCITSIELNFGKTM